jgi:hypothetical protein
MIEPSDREMAVFSAARRLLSGHSLLIYSNILGDCAHQKRTAGELPHQIHVISSHSPRYVRPRGKTGHFSFLDEGSLAQLWSSTLETFHSSSIFLIITTE